MRRGLLLLALVASCAAPPPAPREVRPETDVCPECHMTVISEGHASEAVDRDGRVWVFDDPGCLALYVHDHPAAFEGASYFVQDAETRQWVVFSEASFVRADSVPSPMNYGWHAFSTAERARAFAAGHEGVAAEGEALSALARDLEGRRWRP